MNNLYKFLLFLIYSTTIFFLPNSKLILVLLLLNLVIIKIENLSIKNIIKKSLNILPFIIFTVIINVILDNIENALWIGMKLYIVSNITIIYSETTTVMRNCRNN